MRWEYRDAMCHMLKHMVKPNQTFTIKDRAYTLKNIIVHLGETPHSGHYKAYVKDNGGNWWLHNGDTYDAAKQIPNIVTAKEKVYILMYEQP